MTNPRDTQGPKGPNPQQHSAGAQKQANPAAKAEKADLAKLTEKLDTADMTAVANFCHQARADHEGDADVEKLCSSLESAPDQAAAQKAIKEATKPKK